MSGDTSDIARTRMEFFRRTRRGTRFLYAGMAIAAVGLLAGGIATAAIPALLAFVAVTVVAVALFALSPLIPISAKAARSLFWLAIVAGVLLARFVDLDISTPGFLGGTAGFFTGTGIGIALIRRRLAHDDDLLRRQQRLGFNLERPWAWLRKG